jgi:hypothetical protein
VGWEEEFFSGEGAINYFYLFFIHLKKGKKDYKSKRYGSMYKRLNIGFES